MRTPVSSGAVAPVDSLRDKKGKRSQRTRSDAGKGESKKGAAGAHGGGRKLARTAAAVANSGVEFSQPGGVIDRGRRGEMLRGPGAI